VCVCVQCFFPTEKCTGTHDWRGWEDVMHHKFSKKECSFKVLKTVASLYKIKS